MSVQITVPQAIRAVTRQLLDAEKAVEDSAITLPRCIATIVEVRRDARMPFDTGRDAIALLNQAQHHALKMRECMIDGHAMLKALPATLDGSGDGFGPICPQVRMITGVDIADREEQGVRQIRA
jgi:hypothetical protein